MRRLTVSKPQSTARISLRRWTAVCMLAMALIVARGGWLMAQAHDDTVGPAGMIAAGTFAERDASPDAPGTQHHHPGKGDTSCRLRSTIVTIQQHDGPGASAAPADLACTAPPHLSAPGSVTPSEVVASPSARRALLQVYLN
jgi:hypothetical protein